jgi:hypothetical protein
MQTWQGPPRHPASGQPNNLANVVRAARQPESGPPELVTGPPGTLRKKVYDFPVPSRVWSVTSRQGRENGKPFFNSATCCGQFGNLA